MNYDDIFTTEDVSEYKEVIHNYDNFDFTTIPCLKTEEDFQEYHEAFMARFKDNAFVKRAFGESVTVEALNEDAKLNDGESMYMAIGVYNGVARLMGHESLGGDDD